MLQSSWQDQCSHKLGKRASKPSDRLYQSARGETLFPCTSTVNGAREQCVWCTKEFILQTYCDRQRQIAKRSPFKTLRTFTERWLRHVRTRRCIFLGTHSKAGVRRKYSGIQLVRTSWERARLCETKSILYICNAGGFIQELFSILWASHKSNRWQKTFLSWLSLAKVVTPHTLIKPWAVAN